LARTLKNNITNTPWITKNKHALQRAARDPQQHKKNQMLEKDEFRPEAPALSNDKEICSDDGGWKRYNGSTGGDENRTGVLFNSWISWR
jgi:hypothetical protein